MATTSNLLSWNDVSLLITRETNDTPPTTSPVVVYNDSDTLIQLLKSNCNQIYLISNVADVRINLPEYTTISDLGLWVFIHKLNTGDISIYTSSGTAIEDSAVDGYVINNNSTQTWANIGLFLAKTTLWKFIGAPLGTWETS